MPDTNQSDPLYGLSQRVPPHNDRAEMALLGALLANNKALGRVEEFLKPEHFYDPVHGQVYAAIMRRVASGGVADAVSLKGELNQVLSEVGGSGYLGQLLAAMVGVVNAGEYGKAVRDCWMRRELIDACADAMAAAFGADAAVTCPPILEALDARLLRIVEGAGDEAPSTQAADAIREAVTLAHAASQRVGGLAGITTGYAALDRMTAGLQRQQLILLGARPSMGKTALGLGLAYRAAMAGARVYFWSGEMAAAQLGARAAAAYCGLPTTSVFTGRHWGVPEDAKPGRVLDQGEWDNLVAAERAARTLGLEFDTRPGLTVQAIRARARRMKRHGGLDLLMIDYVGLLRAASGNPRLYERITEISAELMALKTELDVPLVAMVQLNRANEGRDDKMPQLSDLRDSGALEQDANVVMLLHRPHYYLTRSDPQRRGNEAEDAFANRLSVHMEQVRQWRGAAQVSVAKNRNGPTGLTRLRFQDECSWFRDESEAENGPAWGSRMGV